MVLNEKKTKYMIFNFSKKYPFSTRLELKNTKIERISEIKLLGTVITDDLKWERNTAELVKKGNARMRLLTKVASFTKSIDDLKNIYTVFIRSILENSAVVWHSGLSAESNHNLERVQKTALKIILGNKYTNYSNSLEILNFETLQKRRENL